MMSTEIDQVLEAAGIAGSTKNPERPPVPYRVQMAHNIIQMYSAKSSHGMHAASLTVVTSTDLSEKEQQLYNQCIEVLSTWISGENQHEYQDE